MQHPLDPVDLAALNNAQWCDLVCTAHGVPGQIGPHFWSNPHPVPPFHSNLTTLGASAAAMEAQIAEVDRLLALRGGLSFKDGYGVHDGSRFGMRPLFAAQWLWREPPDRPRTTNRGPWSSVDTAADLDTWEAAWRGDAAHAAQTVRQFPASLLGAPGVCFYAGWRDDRITAVGIANQTGPVVGLSNVVIDGSEDPAEVWEGLLQAVQRDFGPCPQVGYARAGEVPDTVGFREMGELVVWAT